MGKSLLKSIRSKRNLSITHESLVKFARISLVLVMVEMFGALYYSWFLQAFGTGLLILVTIGFLFLIKQAPTEFELLWERGVIYRREGKENNILERKDEYEKFIMDLVYMMSHPAQLLIAFIVMMIVLTRAPIKLGGVERVFEMILKYPFGWLTPMLIEGFFGFIFGLIVWRIFLIGLWISRLGRKFYISPILGHPDESGGLRPIGNICLKIGFICSVLPTAIGGLLLLNLLPPHLVKWSILIFIIVIPLPFTAFILPLFSIHRAMHEAKARTEMRINELNGYIHSNMNDLLDHFDQMKSSEIQEYFSKIEYFKKIYIDGEKFPTWPFNLNMLLRFFTSQIIPSVAFIKSLFELIKA